MRHFILVLGALSLLLPSHSQAGDVPNIPVVAFFWEATGYVGPSDLIEIQIKDDNGNFVTFADGIDPDDGQYPITVDESWEWAYEVVPAFRARGYWVSGSTKDILVTSGESELAVWGANLSRNGTAYTPPTNSCDHDDPLTCLVVNLTDYLLFGQCYLKSSTYEPTGGVDRQCEMADTNNSGAVNLPDFLQYGRFRNAYEDSAEAYYIDPGNEDVDDIAFPGAMNNQVTHTMVFPE